MTYELFEAFVKDVEVDLKLEELGLSRITELSHLYRAIEDEIEKEWDLAIVLDMVSEFIEGGETFLIQGNSLRSVKEIYDALNKEYKETPKRKKRKYVVTFTKREAIEVEAYTEDEAKELAKEILEDDAHAWEGPEDAITIEDFGEVKD